MNIHPTAIVSEKAKLAKDVQVGPYALIEDDVKIDAGVTIASHAQILNQTTIAEGCQIHIGVILGHSPQIREYSTSKGKLIIGKKNVFREYATVHRASQDGCATVIGDDNYFMGFSHLAHDCNIAHHVTICNGTLLAGHVAVENHAFISGNVTVHQFCRIGEYSMIGGLARVAKDVPPYMLVKGDSTVWAVNSIGLRRANFSQQARSEIKKAFKVLYKSNLNVKQAIRQLQEQFSSCEIKHLIDFVQHSQRGICTEKSPSVWERIRFSSFVLRGARVPAYQLFQKQLPK